MASTSRPPRSLLSLLLRGGVAGVLLAIALHVGYVLGGSNFRTVLPGQVYRCAQPSGSRLERLVRQHGIRTVVNLRGCCPTLEWYQQEARVTSDLEVSQEDVGFSASRLPSALTIRHLLDVLDRSEYPILLHCHQGADRTGLAAVMVVLLRTEATLAEALGNLGLTSGHLAFGRTRHIDRFFDLYRDWLVEGNHTHSPDLFRGWVREHYCPAEGRADLALLTPHERRPGQLPRLRILPGQRLVKVRCTNTSRSDWHFEPGNTAGIHAWWSVLDDAHRLRAMDRAGLFHATIPPGGHIDLTIPLPALPSGRYEFRVDLADEQHGFFAQLGNDLLAVDLEVP